MGHSAVLQSGKPPGAGTGFPAQWLHKAVTRQQEVPRGISVVLPVQAPGLEARTRERGMREGMEVGEARENWWWGGGQDRGVTGGGGGRGVGQSLG